MSGKNLEEQQRIIYTAQRRLPPGRRPNGEYWAFPVIFSMRSDGKLEIEFAGIRLIEERDRKKWWLRRAGLNEKLEPVQSVKTVTKIKLSKPIGEIIREFLLEQKKEN